MKSKIVLSMIAAFMLTTFTAFGAGITFGSAGALKDTKLTNTEMLTYAIQDEYLAKAEYDKIIVDVLRFTKVLHIYESLYIIIRLNADEVLHCPSLRCSGSFGNTVNLQPEAFSL